MSSRWRVRLIANTSPSCKACILLESGCSARLAGLSANGGTHTPKTIATSTVSMSVMALLMAQAASWLSWPTSLPLLVHGSGGVEF